MNAVLEKHYISVADYLAAEELADYKSEYYAGEVFPMAGGTVDHNQIVINLCIILGIAFKKRDFRVLAENVKLHIPAWDTFTYPDVLIIKEPPEYWNNRRDIISNAVAIIEVLSDSTKEYDRFGKFDIYRAVPDLQDYILISQDKVQIEHFCKQSPKQWLLTEYNQLSEVLTIAQLGNSLTLADIYDKVDL